MKSKSVIALRYGFVFTTAMTTRMGIQWCSLLIGITVAGSLSAADLVENGDFPNTSPGTPFALEVGTNTVRGNLSTPNDGSDRLNVEVPVGHRLISVSGSISPNPPNNTNTQDPSGFISFGTFNNSVIFAINDMNRPNGSSTPISQALPAGNYPLTANADFSAGNAWNTTFEVETLPDYEVTLNGSLLIIDDISGNDNTLTVSSSPSDTSKLLFSAPGRTFTFNDGPKLTGSSGDLDLSSVNEIRINTRDGDDTINVGTLSGSVPNLNINGGEGDDIVQFSGTMTFAEDASLEVDLTNEGSLGDRITVGAGAAFRTLGDGEITLRCNQQVQITDGARLTTTDGPILIEGNTGPTPSSGNFRGVALQGSGTLIRSEGAGGIVIRGRGGDSGTGQIGVSLDAGAQVRGGSGGVTVEGTGGPSTGQVNRGITLFSLNTQISSVGGDVNVTGVGGNSGSAFGIGISLFSSASISASEGGNVVVTGLGQGSPDSTNNFGVEIIENASITTDRGDITISASDGVQEEQGLVMGDSGNISSSSGAGDIRIMASGLQLAGLSSITTSASSASVTLAPTDGITDIQIGDASALGRLDLTDDELDRISTSSLICESTTGSVNLNGEVSPEQVDRFTVSVDEGVFTQSSSGGIVSLPDGVFAIEGTFQQAISDLTSLQTLVVNSELDLTEASLQAIGFEPLQDGDSFVLIQNDGSDAILGNFLDLPEGALLSFGPTSAHVATISYLGGTGNDVTLTAPAFIQVANNNDSGPGSLRQALVDATSPALIDFDPDFFIGGENNTITLTGALTMPGKVLILDAQSAGGITLDGNRAGRVVSSSSGGTITLDGFSITGGSSAVGAGVLNSQTGATMTLLNCSIFDNTATNAGGGILNLVGSTLTATNCTIYNNHADSFGGGVENNGSGAEMTLNNCTIVRNSSDGSRGGLSNNGDSLVIGNTLVAQNSAPDFPDVSDSVAGTITFSAPNLIRDNSDSSGIFPVGNPNAEGNYVGDSTTPLEPLLVGDIGDRGTAFINNGGSTPTILPLPGSPAIGNGILTDETPLLDQRGESRFGNPDIGATQPDWGELVSAVTPPSAFADITDPTSSIQAFPTDQRFVGQGPDQAIDNMISGFSDKYFTLQNFNAGLEIVPRIGPASIVGLSITIPREGRFERDPTTFLLLGSNDNWNYTPVFNGEVPPFTNPGDTQTFFRSIQSEPYRSYRLIFPSVRFGENPNGLTFQGTAVAQIELLGLPEDNSLRILDCQTSQENGSNQIEITFTSDPSRSYQFNAGTTLSLGEVDAIPSSDGSFISSVTIDALEPTLFVRIEEAPEID